MIHIYILQGENGRYYTGITNNLIRRMHEHATGQSKSTKKMGELTLRWCHKVDDRKEARRLEVKIKGLGAARFLKTYGIK